MLDSVLQARLHLVPCLLFVTGMCLAVLQGAEHAEAVSVVILPAHAHTFLSRHLGSSKLLVSPGPWACRSVVSAHTPYLHVLAADALVPAVALRLCAEVSQAARHLQRSQVSSDRPLRYAVSGAFQGLQHHTGAEAHWPTAG